MPAKTVTIIIPTFNSGRYISRCLDSVINQTYRNLEIICVDDTSSDKTGLVIAQLAKTDRRIRLIKKRAHTGVSDSRNIGIEKANGDYIFFLDADDTIYSTVIEELLTASEKEKNTLIGTTFLGDIKTNPDLGKVTKTQLIQDIISGRTHGSACLYLFPKQSLKNIRFDTRTVYLEDALFMVNFLTNTNYETIQFINRGYNYAINQASCTKSSRGVLTKCKSIEHSLENIDRLTDGKYHDALELKKISLIESQLQHAKTYQELKAVRRNINLPNVPNNKRLRVFWLIYSKFHSMLPLYYQIRRMIKTITKKPER